MVQIGLDTGRIIIYKTNVESHYIQYEKKAHKMRDNGSRDDSEKNLIYSCSTDKKFYATKVSTGESKEVAESTSGYTSLIFDKANSRIFLTNEKGKVSVFLTNEDPLK